MPGENQLMLVIRTDSNYNGIHIYVMNRYYLISVYGRRRRTQLVEHKKGEPFGDDDDGGGGGLLEINC